jgi:hypothetical protein
VQGGPIVGYARLNPNQHKAAQEVINQLQYAEIWRQQAGTLYKNATFRVDMQGLIAGTPVQHNLKVQTRRLDQQPPGALVAAGLRTAAPPAGLVCNLYHDRFLN